MIFIGGGVHSGLTIKNSDKNALIRKSFFTESSLTMPDSWWGLGLIDVKNIVVEECTFFNNLLGIHTSRLENSEIINVLADQNSRGLNIHGI